MCVLDSSGNATGFIFILSYRTYAWTHYIHQVIVEILYNIEKHVSFTERGGNKSIKLRSRSTGTISPRSSGRRFCYCTLTIGLQMQSKSTNLPNMVNSPIPAGVLLLPFSSVYSPQAFWQGQVRCRSMAIFPFLPSSPNFFFSWHLSTGHSCPCSHWFESNSGGRSIICELFRILRRIHLWVSSLIARRTLY